MTILQSETYRRLVAALSDPETRPFGGSIEDAVKLALGEIADVWPASIFPGEIVGDDETLIEKS